MNHENRLLDAVDVLTKSRTIHTTIIDEETGEWLSVHSEQHPALLAMLRDGLGIPNRAGSTETKIPIDAEALELWGQIRDLLKLWCKQLKTPFDEDLITATNTWYIAHDRAVRRGKIGPGTDLDVTRMVESWARMITNKYDPHEILEWRFPCPNLIVYSNTDIRMCGARRILLDDIETFAIRIDATTGTATCRECGRTWDGPDGLAELRFLTNAYEKAIHQATLLVNQA